MVEIRKCFLEGWDIKNVKPKARLFYVKPCKKLFSDWNLSIWKQNFETTYILTAHAKGLSPNRILVTHSLPNSLITPITMLGLQIGLLISSIVIIETLFGLPGIGRGLMQACLARDFPVIQTLSCCLILFSLLISLAVDIISRLINPVMGTYQDI